MNRLGIYVQVPFCQTRCTYCNFHTGVVAKERFAPYVEAVCREIRGHRELLRAAGVNWGSAEWRVARMKRPVIWRIRCTSAAGRQVCWSQSSCRRFWTLFGRYSGRKDQLAFKHKVVFQRRGRREKRHRGQGEGERTKRRAERRYGRGQAKPVQAAATTADQQSWARRAARSLKR